MGKDTLKADALVVGGGPAGLATGIALRRRGWRVVVADSDRPPIEKACGEGLMPLAVAALRNLGVALSPMQAMPFRGIRFIGESNIAQGTFQRVCGWGVRRTVLHQALAERAEETGVELRWGTHVQSAGSGTVSLNSRPVQCRWIVGADGQNSQVRRWAGLDNARPQAIRFGFRRHFHVAPWTDYIEAYWGRDCQMVITPIARDEICLAVTSRSSAIRTEEALGEFPDVARRLAKQNGADSERGAISALRILPRVVCDPFVLVGDASGSVDSLTGEGLGLAFHHADALAEAMARGDLTFYAAAHRRINRPHERSSQMLFALEHRRWLRRRVFGALAREPYLFDRLLAAESGGAGLPSFGTREIVRLGWRLLAEAG